MFFVYSNRKLEEQSAELRQEIHIMFQYYIQIFYKLCV